MAGRGPSGAYTDLPAWAGALDGHVAFAWRMMEAFFEEDERIVGHAVDLYHRDDIRTSSRHLVVRDGERVVAETRRPLALHESGFAPRWYAPRDDIVPGALSAVEGQTFCPYKGLCSYHDVGSRRRAAWSYLEAWPEAAKVSGNVSFEPDLIDAGRAEAGARAGVDRGLDTDEIKNR